MTRLLYIFSRVVNPWCICKLSSRILISSKMSLCSTTKRSINENRKIAQNLETTIRSFELHILYGISCKQCKNNRNHITVFKIIFNLINTNQGTCLCLLTWRHIITHHLNANLGMADSHLKYLKNHVTRNERWSFRMIWDHRNVYYSFCGWLERQ